jgi:hypothetical protein
MELREIGWWSVIGFSWLSIWTGGGLLWIRWLIFGFWRHGVSLISSPSTTSFVTKICNSWRWVGVAVETAYIARPTA